jgi:hypothetical protein
LLDTSPPEFGLRHAHLPLPVPVSGGVAMLADLKYAWRQLDRVSRTGFHEGFVDIHDR